LVARPLALRKEASGLALLLGARALILLAVLARPPGIIVAIGLMRRYVTPKSRPWRLIHRQKE